MINALRLIPSEYNTAMPPAWRWERARWLTENKKTANPKKDDPWVCLVQKFQKEMDKCTSVASYEKLAAKYPALYWAWFWFSDTERRTRYTVEAYLCANASNKQIADRANLHPGVVGCFSKIFFDVEGKQQHWAYMLNEVIARNIHHGLSERDYDVLWKLYGIFQGPIAVDFLHQYMVNPTRLTSRSQMESMSGELVRGAMAVKAIVAARTMPVAYNQEIILTAWNKMVEIEKSSDNPQQGQNLIVGVLNNMVSNFGFVVSKSGRGGSDSLDSASHNHYHENGVERRASHMLMSSLGESSAEGERTSLKFPEVVQDGQPAQQGS